MDAADPGLDLRDVVASASATPLKEVIKESHESMKANDRDETEVSTPPESVNSALNRSPHCGHISKEKNLSLRISADLKTAQPSTQHERIGTLPSPIIPSPLQLPPHEGDGLSTSTTMMLPPRQAANRCMVCQKRVGLVGFKCRCGDLFCATHRYSDRHDCSFDYKAAGRKAIAKENPVVKASKIEKI
ncbi:hypothetical protein KP509_03G040000 [Ceratopteris richardii]|nr:hypothetical protein KP509_03G040000 [Ceratopteris richardii]